MKRVSFVEKGQHGERNADLLLTFRVGFFSLKVANLLRKTNSPLLIKWLFLFSAGYR